MDLRDEFACQAMNGFLAGYCSNENCAPIDRLSHDRMAVEAYRVADFMIEARKTSEQAESPATAGNSASMAIFSELSKRVAHLESYVSKQNSLHSVRG